MSAVMEIGKRSAWRANWFRYLQLRPLISIGVLRSGWAELDNFRLTLFNQPSKYRQNSPPVMSPAPKADGCVAPRPPALLARNAYRAVIADTTSPLDRLSLMVMPPT